MADECPPQTLHILRYQEVRTIMQKLRSFFPICRACTVTEPVARTENLMDVLLVGESQYPALRRALDRAKKALDFEDDVDLYVVSSPGPNAACFRLPGEPAQIKMTGALVGLLGLLDPANEKLALVVLLHELAHLQCQQTQYKTAMRLYTAFLQDGTAARAALLQQAEGAFHKYLVAMELTADLVMFRALTKELGGAVAKRTVRRVFAKFASGVEGVEADGDAYYAQLQDCKVHVEQTMLAAADPHPPLGLRLQLLHCESEWRQRSTLHAWSDAVKESRAPQAHREEPRAREALCSTLPAGVRGHAGVVVRWRFEDHHHGKSRSATLAPR
jgi:Zn-dependent protease with chaperone function